MIDLMKGSQLAVLAVITLALAGCGSSAEYKRQASGSDAYLKATPLKTLRVPANITLPKPDDSYVIPVGQASGTVGLGLDIRPPRQPLPLLGGSQVQYRDGVATLSLDNSAGGSLWSRIENTVNALRYPVVQKNDASQTLTTDWISWSSKDEKEPYRARYQLAVQSQGYGQQLAIKLLELQQADKPVSNSQDKQRYSVLLLNQLSAAMEQQEMQQQKASNNRAAGQLDVQNGADDVGLPVLIVRGTFNVVWSRLPAALEKIGMKVKDSNRPQGNLSVTYSPLSAEQWQTLGARDPGLPSGKYKLQVGDLDNRSSLQFIDPKGHTLTQMQNNALVAVFQAAFG